MVVPVDNRSYMKRASDRAKTREKKNNSKNKGKKGIGYFDRVYHTKSFFSIITRLITKLSVKE